MAVIVVEAVVVAGVVLVALMVVVFVVTMQIHREERRYREGRRAWEERRQWNRSVHREQIPIPLTRPAPSGWASFARSVCGVYINGMGGEPASEFLPEEAPEFLPEGVLPWYERTVRPRPRPTPS